MIKIGWSSGGYLLADIVDVIDPHIDKAHAVGIYTKLIKMFELQDADTIGDQVDMPSAFNMALRNCGYTIY